MRGSETPSLLYGHVLCIIHGDVQAVGLPRRIAMCGRPFSREQMCSRFYFCVERWQTLLKSKYQENTEYARLLLLIVAEKTFGIKPDDYMTGYQNVNGAKISGLDELKYILNSNNYFTACIREYPESSDEPGVKEFHQLNNNLNEYVRNADKSTDLSKYTWNEFLQNLDTISNNEQDKKESINNEENNSDVPKELEANLNHERNKFSEPVVNLIGLIAILLFLLTYTWIIRH